MTQSHDPEAVTMEPVPDDWERALAIVAHPDDMEYGAAAAVAHWTAAGKRVAYLLVTRGETGIDTLDPAECARIREAEERASARVVGVETVEFLDHADGLVEYGLVLRRDLALAIRRYRPEVVVTLNHQATWGGASFNMADHRHVGLAALDAIRDAANPWLFRDDAVPPADANSDAPDSDGVPAAGAWAGVRFALVAGANDASHFVDVSDQLELGIASLEAHQRYLEHVGTNAREFLTAMAEQTGLACGTRYATSFGLVPA
jgi:LmbE family N-acetylglucosaminyl deacetylase